jgi:16S rRNA (adenine1518-N6/adenine1519-N6)-dimethyltransferase
LGCIPENIFFCYIANSAASRYIVFMPDSSSRKTESLLTQTKRLLQSHGLRAKKGLGQNFLVNAGILTEITHAAELTAADLALEIGPGLGILTGALAEQAGYVIGVELDAGLAATLQEALTAQRNVSIIHADILKTEPAELIEQEKSHFPSALKALPDYKLVANLPYYITQPVIRHFCEARLKPQMMVLMVQKEVAKNITAAPGEMSILAVAVQYFGQPEIVRYVPAPNFYPVPKVDSAIIKITMYREPPVQVTAEKHFFEIVRAGFCAARKQIVNSLAQGLDIPKAEVLSLIEKASVPPGKRAEALTLAEWARLENEFARGKKE